MSSNSTFRISNEQLLLINILNTMYNDNLRQINNITESLNNLYNTNNQIRDLLVHILNSVDESNNSRRQGFNERRNRENNRTNERHRNRVFLNNTPYIIDSITEYTIPRNIINNLNSLGGSRHNSNRGYSMENNLAQIFQNFFQPIEVHPTQSQIEAATRNVRYCDISRPINTQCPISMDEFNDNDMVTVIRHCGHTFNTDHIMNWFRSNCRCPVCRYDIREYNSNASTEFFNNSNNTNNTNTANNANNTNAANNANNTLNNNNLAGRNLLRTDSINSLTGSDAFNLLNDSLINNTNFTDVSGNNLDNSSLTMLLLNAFANRHNR
jgi:hypothetical protein